jgi:hypothetical protein
MVDPLRLAQRILTVIQRPLRYPKSWPAEKAQEQGVGNRRPHCEVAAWTAPRTAPR